ncbi:MAG: 16S rRNA (guanine(527)-N(7))-methyltransferase RsmG [Candidatus Nanopelagicales bacterium]|nr:16S rRNA (guanine(527)-N(7))-methyltransferase RsmG [Candidatus Nanopelagicales bacterium]MDZ4248792.1 16S rRNA (guanine(527)-N(7))-methyltransferase RsmG [Candidatus Nanopelagicales bacterium]
MSDPVSRETSGLSLEAFSALVDYEELLATEGTKRGLIGPREAEKLWPRHLLNCAVVAMDDRGLVPKGASVVDVGSGAGLPGLVWALVRPDIHVTVVDSLLRRADFLKEAVAVLGVGSRVEVVRGRAEALSGDLAADVATARAVAPLPKLLTWLAPLVKPGGTVLAFKGESVTREVAESTTVLARLGLGQAQILRCGSGVVDPPTVVVRYQRSS